MATESEGTKEGDASQNNEFSLSCGFQTFFIRNCVMSFGCVYPVEFWMLMSG